MSTHQNPLSIYFRRLVFAGTFVAAQFILSVVGYYLIGLHLGHTPSILNCAYLTLITLTTIGYGEILPYAEHPYFRVFTMFVIVFGIGTFLYLISAATSFIFDGQLRQYLQRKSMDRQIAKLSGHYIVCGAGQTGLHICEELLKTKNAVVAIDVRQERLKILDDALEENFLSLLGDSTEDAILEEAGIRRAAGLVSALPDDKDNLFCVITARSLNPNVRIISRAIDQKSAEKLTKGGADKVVSTHFIGAMRMTSELIRPQVVNFLDLMLQQKDPTIRIEEVRLGTTSRAIGRTLQELDIRKYGEMLVLSVYQPGTKLYQHNPGPAFKLQQGMVLVVLGNVTAVQTLRKMIGSDLAASQ